MAIMLLGYYWGNRYAFSDLEKLSAVVHQQPLDIAPDVRLTSTKEDTWRLILPGDSTNPACNRLLAHYTSVFSRLAARPAIQQHLRLIMLDRQNSPLSTQHPWQQHNWSQVEQLTADRHHALTKALGIQPIGNRWCEKIQATAALLDPQWRLTALIPYEQPAKMAHNIQVIIETLGDPDNMSESTAPTLKDKALTNLLKVVPQHLLSAGMYKLARMETPWLKDFIINQVVRNYQVDMSEAAEPDQNAYPSFNALFTRELKEGARPIAGGAVVSPSDGRVSQAGQIDGERLIQAKGHDYSLLALLAGDKQATGNFNDGSFATIYLSPRDYHRVHMPYPGKLKQMVFVPGDLFSVSNATTQLVPGLFARNERVICYFDTDRGPMAVILVGAIFVGSMDTVWAGEVRGLSEAPTKRNYSGEEAREFAAGDEIGRFNMGSTVIVLFGKDAVQWKDIMQPGEVMRMGQAIASPL